MIILSIAVAGLSVSVTLLGVAVYMIAVENR